MKQLGEGITSDLDSIFLAHLLADSGGPQRVGGVIEQVMQLGGDVGRGVAVSRNRPGDAQAQGMTNMGHPERIAKPVVPIPPWWTTAAARGNSSEKGA